MPLDQAFLLAICTDPADDAPRLAYADYLEERGDPRGEFIRVQCALNTGPSEQTDWCHHDLTPQAGCQGCNFNTRERELLTLHADTWALPVALACGIPDTPMVTAAGGKDSFGNPRYHHVCSTHATTNDLRVGWRFRRGFVAAISLPQQVFLDHAAALFAAQPIEEVRLTDKGGDRFNTWFRTPPYAEYNIGDDESNLDARIFDCLQGGTPGNPRGPQPHAVCWRDYGGRSRQRVPPPVDGVPAAMLADLSQACVAWGRQQAGLPALASSHSVVIG